MSEIRKTIIVPGGNARDVVGKPILKMVVLGNNEQVAKSASRLALYPPTNTDRYVLWFKNPSHSELKQLFENLDEDISNVVAFSVSTKDVVVDYIRTGETIDNVRLDHAYTKAGLREYN